MAVRGVVFDLDGTLYGMPWYMKPLLFASLVPHGMRLPAYMRVRAEHAGRDHGTGSALMTAMCADLGRRIAEEDRLALLVDTGGPRDVQPPQVGQPQFHSPAERAAVPHRRGL